MRARELGDPVERALHRAVPAMWRTCGGSAARSASRDAVDHGLAELAARVDQALRQEAVAEALGAPEPLHADLEEVGEIGALEAPRIARRADEVGEARVVLVREHDDRVGPQRDAFTAKQLRLLVRVVAGTPRLVTATRRPACSRAKRSAICARNVSCHATPQPNMCESPIPTRRSSPSAARVSGTRSPRSSIAIGAPLNRPRIRGASS